MLAGEIRPADEPRQGFRATVVAVLGFEAHDASRDAFLDRFVERRNCFGKAGSLEFAIIRASGLEDGRVWLLSRRAARGWVALRGLPFGPLTVGPGWTAAVRAPEVSACECND